MARKNGANETCNAHALLGLLPSCLDDVVSLSPDKQVWQYEHTNTRHHSIRLALKVTALKVRTLTWCIVYTTTLKVRTFTWCMVYTTSLKVSSLSAL